MKRKRMKCTLQSTRKKEFKGKEGWKGRRIERGKDGMGGRMEGRRWKIIGRMEWLNGSGRIRGGRKDRRERMDGGMKEKSRMGGNRMNEKGKDGLKEKKRMHGQGGGGWKRNERCKE